MPSKFGETDGAPKEGATAATTEKGAARGRPEVSSGKAGRSAVPLKGNGEGDEAEQGEPGKDSL